METLYGELFIIENESRAGSLLPAPTGCCCEEPLPCTTTMDGGSARIAGAYSGLVWSGLVGQSLAFGSRHLSPDFEHL